MNGGKGPGAARTVAAVALTLAVQSLTEPALAGPSVLAPVVAGDFGAAPSVSRA